MASSNDEPGFRVANDLIVGSLVDDAAEEAQRATVLKTESETYSKLSWGPACTKLLDHYNKNIHQQVRPGWSRSAPTSPTSHGPLPFSL